MEPGGKKNIKCDEFRACWRLAGRCGQHTNAGAASTTAVWQRLSTETRFYHCQSTFDGGNRKTSIAGSDISLHTTVLTHLSTAPTKCHDQDTNPRAVSVSCKFPYGPSRVSAPKHVSCLHALPWLCSRQDKVGNGIASSLY
ncbi:unnamed protein product [Ectocarpus fasciculatus]